MPDTGQPLGGEGRGGLPVQAERRRPRDGSGNFGAPLLPSFPPQGSCPVSVLKNFLLAPQPTLSHSRPPQIPPLHSSLLERIRGASLSPRSPPLTLLGPGSLERVLSSSPQDSQLPLVVAMQERVGGSPHCKVTAACVHQDVELSEKGEREMLSTRGSGLTTFMSFIPQATKSPFGMSKVKLLG